MYKSACSWSRHQLEVSGQLHGPAALPLGKELPVPIVWKAGWAPEPVWTTWRGEKSPTIVGFECPPLGRPAYCRSLYRLSYPGIYFVHINYILIFIVRNSEREISYLGWPTFSVTKLCLRNLLQYSKPIFWYVILYPLRALGKEKMIGNPNMNNSFVHWRTWISHIPLLSSYSKCSASKAESAKCETVFSVITYRTKSAPI
jgi:hypothetical protein